jgi:hypothetical protein
MNDDKPKGLKFQVLHGGQLPQPGEASKEEEKQKEDLDAVTNTTLSHRRKG